MSGTEDNNDDLNKAATENNRGDDEPGYIEYVAPDPVDSDFQRTQVSAVGESVSIYCDEVDIDSLALGVSETLVRFDRLGQQRALLTALFEQASSSIILLADRFDMQLLGWDPVLDALTSTLDRNPQLTLRTLVRDSADLVGSGARLAEQLRQHMPRVECRLRKPAADNFAASCIVIDDCAYIYFPNPERRTGSASFNGVGTATKLIDVFEQYWQVAAPDPEMRVLVI